MKNIIRSWLGINDDVIAIAQDMNTLLSRADTTALQLYQVFHALPFVAGVISLTAKDAAALTNPNGIESNSLLSMLLSILMNARQGDSVMEVEGELSDEVREALKKRGFKIEDTEGTAGKTIHITWT